MSDIPVNEWRLLEIERMLRAVPSADTLEAILRLAPDLAEAKAEIELLVRELESLKVGLNAATSELNKNRIEDLVRNGRLDRHIDGYAHDRRQYSDEFILNYYGLGDTSEVPLGAK